MEWSIYWVLECAGSIGYLYISQLPLRRTKQGILKMYSSFWGNFINLCWWSGGQWPAEWLSAVRGHQWLLRLDMVDDDMGTANAAMMAAAGQPH